MYTLADLGLLFGSLGAFERGLAHGHAAIKRAEAGPRQLRPYALAQLAEQYVCMGDLAAAQQLLDELHVDPNPFHMVQPGMITLPECHIALASGDYAAAIASFEKRIASLRQYGMRLYLPETLYLAGQTVQALGKDEEAVAYYTEARREAESQSDQHLLWRIMSAIGSLEARQGNTALARDLREQARAIITHIAEKTGAEELRVSFLTLPAVRDCMP